MDITTPLLERASSWFLSSGIQENGGGVARYYRADFEKKARISLEITGYAVSTLQFLHRRLESTQTLHGLLSAALFLLTAGWDEYLGVFPYEWARAGEAPCRQAYFFDCGIIVRGLLCAWRTVHDRRFLNAAIAGGRSMSDHFRRDGMIHPILMLPDMKPPPWEPRWSANPGCYHLKAALAWLQLHEETGEQTFRDAWEECIDLSLGSHDSFLPGEADQERIMDRLHAYCYFLEGLLAVTDRQTCVRVLSEGIDRVSHFLRQIAPAFERSDVYAQLLRARLYAAASGAIALNEKAAEHEAGAILRFQFQSDDPRVQGAFSFGQRSGGLLPFANPVSTAFCIEALTTWAERKENRFKLDWRDLI